MRKLKVVADVTGKAICTPIILFYAVLVFPWLELYFWWTDDRKFPHKGWHYVKESFRDIKDCITAIWTDTFWDDTFFMKD
jgi:hypothetical protein